MDWTNELTLEFIQLYEKHPVLWNPKDPHHKIRNRLNDAWVKISREFSVNTTITELRKKKESLMSTYRPLAKKVRESETTGSGANDVFVPSWFAYDALNRFIRVTTNKIPSLNSEDTHIERCSEDDTSQGEQETALDQEKAEQENEPNLTHGKTEDKRSLLKNTRFASPLNNKKARPNQANSIVKDHLKQATDPLSTVTSKRKFQTLQDRPALYGQLLATKLRKLPPRTQLILQNKIDNLVFEAELSELDCLNHNGSSIGKFISPVYPVTNSSSSSIE